MDRRLGALDHFEMDLRAVAERGSEAMPGESQTGRPLARPCRPWGRRRREPPPHTAVLVRKRPGNEQLLQKADEAIKAALAQLAKLDPAKHQAVSDLISRKERVLISDVLDVVRHVMDEPPSGRLPAEACQHIGKTLVEAERRRKELKEAMSDVFGEAMD